MIEIRNLSKTFAGADGAVDALKHVSIRIEDGDICGIIGMSGAGKSTLVRCMNFLERPTEGSVLIDGQDLAALSPRELRAMRRRVTMIFQGFNLLMQRTCLDNICFPMEIAGVKRSAVRTRAMELLETVGLPDKANAYPAQLSGGQQQRIAIARALATDPQILLCDEATSALDPNTTRSILELIRKINETMGITVVIITHQMSVVEEICRHVVIMDGGTVAEEGDVASVFARPQSAAARRLVFPDGGEEMFVRNSDEYCLRVVFNGASATKTPLISQLAIEKGIMVNILSAATRNIGDRVYGNMVLGIRTEEELHTALAYLGRVPDIVVEEVV